MQRAAAIIPARFNSTRFPGKPLASLKGKPIIQWVYEHAASANSINTTLVATDNKQIYDTVLGFGGKAVMTSEKHQSGTDRIAEAAKDIDCDIVVNVQGDEPFIRPEMVDDVVRLLSDDPRASISTLAKKTTDPEEILSPNVVKVVFDNEGFAMYFSRAPIPFHRDHWKIQKMSEPPISKGGAGIFELLTFNSQLSTFYCYKHIGIYGYRKDVLLRFASMPPDKLELTEKLEQLRALASGMKIKVKETPHDTFGIDTAEDLKNAERRWHTN
ncbi:MAG: 3-deoxy-manno-octulosonate cytidylyltransferase [Nitrospirae bacterium]|nr:3-deoxy-manno-octulosonate cytidylyltransferase [Nitrospirota bacterium]